MNRLAMALLLVLVMLTTGCATGPRPALTTAEEEWPSGPGTIPPSWYDYDPALKHWFEPWYHNPNIRL